MAGEGMPGVSGETLGKLQHLSADVSSSLPQQGGRSGELGYQALGVEALEVTGGGFCITRVIGKGR